MLRRKDERHVPTLSSSLQGVWSQGRAPRRGSSARRRWQEGPVTEGKIAAQPRAGSAPARGLARAEAKPPFGPRKILNRFWL